MAHACCRIFINEANEVLMSKVTLHLKLNILSLMAKKYCDYQDCRNVRYTYGSITFFTLPNDERRSVWIENSGNAALKFLPNKSVRFICEEHFENKFLMRQFSRTTLSKNAVPIRYRTTYEEHTKSDYFKTGLHKLKRHEKQACNKFNTSNYHESFQASNQESFQLNDQEPFQSNAFEIQTLNSTSASNFKNTADDFVNYNIDYFNENSSESFINLERTNSETSLNGDLYSAVFTERNLNGVKICEGISSKDFIYTKKKREIYSSDSFPLNIKTIEPSVTKIKLIPAYENLKHLSVIKILPLSANGFLNSIRNIKRKTKSKIHIKDKNNCNDSCKNGNNLPILKNCKKIDTVNDQQSTISHMKEKYEEDKYFALSLVGSFQRLPLQKRMVAKVKILQYLMNLEFNDDDSINI
ncbi:uncharacterized protein LOC129615309 [Condylostylus longicornis]|uniref:uncharacterized protein LOC129615309 n=1 Tax=Condylostylus longicornis TaxID=2530218 RepID=UPI00244E364D|nr:uncharacterized protein LOC129615309 [Condylostylus longicornis]